MKLTTAQRATLRFAARVCDSPAFGHEVDGVCPRRGQAKMFEKLRAKGLLADGGEGVDENNHEREVPLYTITDAGRAAIKEAP